MHHSLPNVASNSAVLDLLACMEKMALSANWLSQAANTFQISPQQQAQGDLVLSLFRRRTTQCMKPPPSADVLLPTSPSLINSASHTASKDIDRPVLNDNTHENKCLSSIMESKNAATSPSTIDALQSKLNACESLKSRHTNCRRLTVLKYSTIHSSFPNQRPTKPPTTCCIISRTSSRP